MSGRCSLYAVSASEPSAHSQIALAVSAKMRRSTRRIPALSSTIKNVIRSHFDRSPVRGRDALPGLSKNLVQAYKSAGTKDIEDATHRTVWFHMGMSARNGFL